MGFFNQVSHGEMTTSDTFPVAEMERIISWAKESKWVLDYLCFNGKQGKSVSFSVEMIWCSKHREGDHKTKDWFNILGVSTLWIIDINRCIGSICYNYYQYFCNQMRNRFKWRGWSDLNYNQIIWLIIEPVNFLKIIFSTILYNLNYFIIKINLF